jgi:hypothetical protein
MAGLAGTAAGATDFPELLTGVCPAPTYEIPAPSPGVPAGMKGFLLDEAERLQLPADTRQRLAGRLHSHAFSVTQESLWSASDSFDLTLQSRGEEAGALKTKFSRRKYQGYADRIGELSAAQQDAIRRTALTILADTGYLPEIGLADAGRKAWFMYRQACVINDAPGLMTVYMQGRRRDLDLGSGELGPVIPLKAEKATLNDPAAAFSSDGAAVFQVRREQLERAFRQPAARQLLQTLHDEILEIIPDPVRTGEQVTRLVELIEQAYGIRPVGLDFDTSAAGEGSGYYQHSTRTYIFYYRRYAATLDRLIRDEHLDLTRLDHRQRARDYLFGDLVNTTAHELGHAGQHQWIDMLMADVEGVPAELRPRIADYQKNDRYRNTAWESRALIGIVGDIDYDRYRDQPLEEDAWRLGAYAETAALKLVSTPDAPPVIEADGRSPAAPAAGAIAAAVAVAEPAGKITN